MARPVVVTTDRRSSKAKPYVPSVAGASAAAAAPSRGPRRAAAPSSHMGGGPNLHAIARETKRRIRWDRVLRGAGSTRTGSGTGAQWKWLENVRNFSIYTKQSSALSSGYSVLAIGTIRASVSEVASLLASSSQPEFEQKMVALHDKEFRHAAYLGDLPTYSTQGDDDDDDADQASLSVRSVTFSRPRWLQRDDEWTFLEASQFDTDTQQYEKLLTTLALEDVLPQGRKARFTDAKPFRDIIAGYSVQPEDPSGSMSEPVDASSVSFSGVTPPCVRVHFYAELDAAPSGARGRLGRFVRAPGKHEASTKAMRQRMLTIAKDCDRLAQLVRRRRLGIQVLVDQRRVLPATNVTCVNCERNLLLGKLCRVCGQNVCGSCSDTYERETHKLRNGRSLSHRNDTTPLVRLENIRVCDPCLVRVETADYTYLNDAALGGYGVFPNAPRKSSTVSTSVSEDQSSTAAGDLKQLLHDALMDAPSTQRRGAVMNVIRCVLNQETDDSSVPPSPAMSTTSLHSNFEPVLLTPVSSDREHLFALDKLDVPTTPFDEVETSDMEGRGYAVNPSANVAAPPPFQLTNTETERIQAIEKLGVLKSTEMSTELNIICDIAAKEMDAFATIVTILTADEQHVVGSNVAALEKMVVKREESFCQHTVMSDKPLIVPNPEADVRFSRILPVREMGVKYYCGFPITAGDDNTIIGALCCVDQKKHDITESQYSAMQRLAQTAGKVVKLQGKRHRTSSMVGSNATPSMNTTSAAPTPTPTKTEL